MAYTRQTVTDDVALCLVVPGDEGLPLRATLRYQPSDPLVVEATFRAADESISWILGRDLLCDGLTSTTGDGDVQVWPERRPGAGRDLVMLMLQSPDGQATLALDAADLDAFLTRTFQVVPRGEEGQHLDLDTVIAGLLGH